MSLDREVLHRANLFLIGDAASAGGLLNGVDGNIVGMPINTILDVNLANNGGPTPTHALVPGSPAIDRGNFGAIPGVDGMPFFDQRGAPIRIA